MRHIGQFVTLPRPTGDIILIVFSCALVLVLFGPLLQAGWSVYADHELQVYLGPSGHVPLAKVPSLLLQTEVGYPDQVNRYRPTTYLMWILEASFWGNHPGSWQAARIAMLMISLSSLTVAFGRLFIWPLAASLSSLLMSAPYWSTVWIGIGPNEQYMALFLSAFCWSYASLHGWPPAITVHNRSKVVAWLVCSVSAILLVGIKENMMIILVPLVWLAFISWRADRSVDYRMVLMLAVFGWSTFIFQAVVVGTMRQGVDFYGNPISLSYRLKNLIATFWHSPLIFMAGVLIVLVMVLQCISRSTSNERAAAIARSLWLAVLLQGALFGLALSHAFFYDGWPYDSRYAFPGHLLVFVSVAQLLYLALSIAGEFRPSWTPVLEIGVTIAVLAVAVHSGFAGLRASVETFVEASQSYTRQIENIVSIAASNPSVPLIIESATPYDLEPVFSVNRFVRMRGIRSPMFLRLHNLEKASFPQQPFFYGLIDTLAQISRTGTLPSFGSTGTLPSPFLVEFSPLNELPPGGPCFSIVLAMAPASGCEVIAHITY